VRNVETAWLRRHVRKQYYFRPSDKGLLAWDVDNLVRLSSKLPARSVPLSEIRELDEAWSGDDEHQNWRGMVMHIQLIEEADLSYPIILSADGAVMDGMHRVAKVLLQGGQTIEAVQFAEDPAPDYAGRRPEDLTY
jgi:hypothetical protein